MPAPNDCLAALDETVRGELSDTELEAIIDDLLEEQRIRQTRGVVESLDAAMAERAAAIIEEMQETKAKAKAHKLQTVLIEHDLLALSERGFAATGELDAGLRAAMGGLHAPFGGNRLSVNAIANGLFNDYMGALYTRLQRDGLLPYLNSGAMDLDIARELYDVQLKRPRGDATQNAAAKKIAKTIDEVQRATVRRENRAGASIKLRQGRVVRTTHDVDKMVKEGYEAWRDFEGDLIDWDAMRVPPAQRERVLKEIYRELTASSQTAIKAGNESDSMFTFSEKGVDIAKNISAHRRIIYKDADSWFAHNQRFGFRNLREAVFSDFRRASTNIALMERFGPRPQQMLENVRAKLAERYKDSPEKTDRLNWPRLEHLMRELDGSVNHTRSLMNARAAGIGRGVRALESIALLGNSFLSALVDPVWLGSESSVTHGSLLRGLRDSVWTPMQGLFSSNVRERGYRMGYGLDTWVGEIASRFHSTDNNVGWTAEALRLFFKYNMLGPWTDINKTSIAAMRANELAELTATSFDALPVSWREYLERYEIDEAKWGLLKQVVKVDERGGKLLMPGDVDETLYQHLGEMSQAERARFVDAVQRSLTALYADTADLAVPTPGARERAILRRGTQPGTVTGEAARFFAHLKSFPVTVLTGPVGMLTRNAPNMRAALRGEADLLGLATFVAYATVVGMLAEQASSLASGREPRPWDEKLLRDGFIRGGGAGIYGDFIFGEFNRYGHGLLETIAGPVPGRAADFASIFAATVRGSDTRPQLIRQFRELLPDVFYTKAAMDYLVFYQMQEMVNPGYLRRMEKGYKGKLEQEFFIPPSQTVPFGGGDRLFEGVR